MPKSDEEQFTYQQSLLTLQYANKQNTQDALACVHEGINFAPTDPLTLVATNQYELGFPASLFHGEPINTKQSGVVEETWPAITKRVCSQRLWTATEEAGQRYSAAGGGTSGVSVRGSALRVDPNGEN